MLFATTGIGLDVGSHAIKVVWLRRGVRGVSLVRCLVLERSRLAGLVGEEATGSRLAAGLKANLLGLGLRIHGAGISLSGKEMIFRLLRIPAASAENLQLVTLHEAQQLAGGADVCYDFRLLNLPTATIKELYSLLAVAKQQVVQERLETLAAAGIGVASVRPAAAALLHAYLIAQPSADETVLLLDVGDTVSEAVVVRGGQMVLARGLSPAGRDFTEAIRRTLAVSAAKAEEIKCREGALPQATRARGSGPLAESAEALHSVAEQLAGGIQSTLQLCRTQASLPTLQIGRVLISGGGARLRGLTQHLSEALRVPVEPLNPLAALRLPLAEAQAQQDLAELPTALAVPIGLAAAQVAAEPQYELLPQDRRRQIEFAQHGLYSVLGGALVVLASLGLTAGAFRNASVQNALRVELARMKTDSQQHAEELNRLERTNRRLARSVELLSGATRPALAFFECLDAIRESIPDSVRLTEYGERTGAPAAPDAKGAPVPEITVLASGVVWHADRQLSEVLGEFVEALRRDPRVAAVNVSTKEREESGARGTHGAKVLEFTLEIRPRPLEEQAELPSVPGQE